MSRRKLALSLLAGFASASMALPLLAHPPGERPHLHVGGGVSHPPFPFTMQNWYRDIVYDESSPDANATSLDIYTADPPPEGAPVMVFVHGGGFRVSDKASSKELSPKPEYFASKLGYVFVSMNYRLLPDGRYPRNAQDVANGLAWIFDHIAEFGGDPDSIFLMGHSAGAALVSQVATDETFLKNAGKDLGILKGVIANEGGYGVDTGDAEQAKQQESLYGASWRDIVAVSHVGAGKGIAPFLILHVTGSEPPGNSELQAIGLAKALRDAGIRADVVPLDHVEHFGANERIGRPGDLTTVSVEQFLDSITGRTEPARWKQVRMGPGR